MKPYTRFLAVGALLLLAAGSAAAAVSVTFTDADKYSDMPNFEAEKKTVLNQLDTHFKKLASGMPPGHDLTVEVLDIDLAGWIPPNRADRDIRVLKGAADWPKMHLRYQIMKDGKVVSSGEERIADMTYMEHLNRYPSSDTLRYEKKMIDTWFMSIVSARQVMGQPSNTTAATH